uniref:Piwi domain-containing protein n=1 Tax=Meloidogyne hapla TaxID=6305 RepID=A0A1I8BDL7_MELHA
MSTLPLRKSSSIIQDAEKTLQEANIQPGATLLATKKEPGTVDVGHGQKIVTNVYLLEMSKRKDLFRYEVTISGVGPRGFDLTRRSTSDYRSAQRRFQCYSVIKAFKTKHATFLLNESLYYDCGSSLFSTFDLKVPSVGIEEVYTLEEIREHSPHLGNDVSNSYKLKILPVHDNKKLPKLCDFSHVTEDAAKIDRTTQQFLDISTSLNVFDDPVLYTHFSTSDYYLLNPSNFGFTDQDCPVFHSNSSFLGIGMHKGIRTVEHGSKGMSEAIVASVKKTPFHCVQLVSDKLTKQLGTQYASRMKDTEWIKERVEGSLKGLFVSTNHSERNRIFEIHGLSSTNLHNEFIQREGNTRISLFDYYTQQYNIDFEFPEWPLLINKYSTGPNAFDFRHYPMEVCTILDNQRVKTDQQDAHMIAEMIRKCAIPPAELKKQNSYLKNSLQLDGSEYLAGLGIKCQNDPIEVTARVLSPPELEFSSQSKQFPKLPRCSWNDSNEYFFPATCNKWVALALFGSQQDAITMEQWTDFVRRFRSVLSKNRMNFAEPQILTRQVIGADLKLIIQGYYEQGYEYMLIAHPDGADQVHHSMKYIEQKTEVVTQGVKMSTVKNVIFKDRFQTLANIVHKTNVKMGGLNYTISVSPQSDLRPIFGDSTLIIGIGSNHPAGGIGMGQGGAQPTTSTTEIDKNGNSKNGNGGNGNNVELVPRGNTPSVVGEANRDEKVGIIADIVKRCAEQFNKFNSRYPTRLILYRDGSGEGSFQKILKYEVPLIHNAFSELGFVAKITLIVVNKMQSVRFYAKHIDERAKSPEQNILPGTVVDKDIVHPLWTEFFLNSHVAIQGTSKTPRYNVLLDENDLTMDTLQLMTHNLCFGHQIVYSPTSLPTPVMVALEYAKRGRNNYNYYNCSGSGGNLNGAATIDHKHLTEHLSFQKSVFLKHMRVNA